MKRQSGFTLVELMLAMSFLAAILVLSTGVIVQAFNIYNKGLAVKQINQLGRTLTEDMTRAANSGRVVVSGAGTEPHVLCLGSSIYIWNTVANIKSTTLPKPVKTFTNPIYGEVNLVKVNSPSGTDCTDSVNQQVVRESAKDMLSDQVRVLSGEVSSVADSNLVNITFVFGTYNSDATSSTNPKETSPGVWQCGADRLSNYCAVGKYSTTLYLPNPNKQT